MKALLKAGADANDRNKKGQTALHLAARYVNHHQQVELLLKAGANPDALADDKTTALMIAASAGAAASVEMLLKADAKAPGWTALHWAVVRGDKERLRKLIQPQADVNVKDAAGSSPLHIAVMLNRQDLAEMLLEAGADVDPSTLVAAIWPGRGKFVKLLIERAEDINAPGADGLAPLHKAAMLWDWEIVDLLITAGADINVRTPDGSTPLHFATAKHSDAGKEITDLLMAAGADPLARNNAGERPFQHNTSIFLGQSLVEAARLAEDRNIDEMTKAARKYSAPAFAESPQQALRMWVYAIYGNDRRALLKCLHGSGDETSAALAYMDYCQATLQFRKAAIAAYGSDQWLKGIRPSYAPYPLVDNEMIRTANDATVTHNSGIDQLLGGSLPYYELSSDDDWSSKQQCEKLYLDIGDTVLCFIRQDDHWLIDARSTIPSVLYYTHILEFFFAMQRQGVITYSNQHIRERLGALADAYRRMSDEAGRDGVSIEEYSHRLHRTVNRELAWFMEDDDDDDDAGAEDMEHNQQ